MPSFPEKIISVQNTEHRAQAELAEETRGTQHTNPPSLLCREPRPNKGASQTNTSSERITNVTKDNVLFTSENILFFTVSDKYSCSRH